MPFKLNETSTYFFFPFSLDSENSESIIKNYDKVCKRLKESPVWIQRIAASDKQNGQSEVYDKSFMHLFENNYRPILTENVCSLLFHEKAVGESFRWYTVESNILRNSLCRNLVLEFLPGEKYIDLNIETIDMLVSSLGTCVLFIEVKFEKNTDILQVTEVNGSFDIINEYLEDSHRFFRQVPRKLWDKRSVEILRKQDVKTVGKSAAIERMRFSSLESWENTSRKLSSKQKKSAKPTSLNLIKDFRNQVRVSRSGKDDKQSEIKPGRYFYLRDLMKLLLYDIEEFIPLRDKSLTSVRLQKLCVCQARFKKKTLFSQIGSRIASFRCQKTSAPLNFPEDRFLRVTDNITFISSLRGSAVMCNCKAPEDRSVGFLVNNRIVFAFIYSLCLLYMETMFDIRQNIRSLSNDILKRETSGTDWDVKQIINRLNAINLRFISLNATFWLPTITNDQVFEDFYKQVRDIFTLDECSDDLRYNIELLHSQAQRKSEQRLRKITKAITIISCVFLPVTVIASILGMNVMEFTRVGPSIMGLVITVPLACCVLLTILLFIVVSRQTR